MTLPKKTLLTIGLAFAGLIGVLYAASSTILLNSIRQAEEKHTRQAVAGVSSIFIQNQDDFNSRFADWSIWDETYAFIKDANKNYTESNLNSDTLASLKINLALFIQPSGRITHGTGFDQIHQKKTPIPAALRSHLSPQKRLLLHPNTESSLAGILLLPEGPMLISSRPILTSEAKGPIRGTLIFGSYLDTKAIARLSKISRLPLTMHALNKRKLPPDFQAVRDSLSNKPILVRPLSEQTIAGYTVLQDIYGKPALLLRVDVPRDIYHQGQNSLRYLIASLLIAGLLFGGVILLLLQRLLLSQRKWQQSEEYRISERKRVLETLQESEERLKSILDNSPALVYLKDTQGRYLLVNHRYETLFHLDREEIKGKTDYDLFPKEMAEVYRVNDQKVLETGTALESEEVASQDDGLHTYLSIKFPLYDGAGVAYAVCGISTDISERKRTEEALQSSVATNRALLNAIPDLMVHLSKDGTFVNYKLPKAMSLPVPASEFLGKTLYEVLPVEVAQPAIGCIQQALQTGKVQLFEFQLLINNNLQNYEARIVVSAANEVMAIVRDITNRKRAEADIRNALEKEKELGELKSRFVTMASHEFRTPLATILSSTELIEHYSHKWSEEKKLTHLQRIQVAVKQMTGLLNDVLLIGKAEAGKLEFNPTPLDLSQFCRNLVEEMQTSSSSHSIAFCSQGQCQNAVMDEKLLGHVLSNLLSNAIKYSPQGDTVNFELIYHQETVTFQVRDEGIGIPEADQAQLFNSFHRASNVGTISGTGLGLAIVKKSVDLHNGKLTVESEVEVGTTFTVMIPLNNSATHK